MRFLVKNLYLAWRPAHPFSPFLVGSCVSVFVCGVRFVCIARVCSCLVVGSSDRRVGSAFVRMSVWVFACVCMRFCMFVSAFVMRSYVR